MSEKALPSEQTISFFDLTWMHSVKKNGKGPCCILKLHPLEVVQVHRHEVGFYLVIL